MRATIPIQCGPHKILAREVVERAADEVEDPATKTWLRFDEFGTWENRAREWLSNPNLGEIAAKGTRGQTIDALGVRMALDALDAMARHRDA